MEVKRLTEKTQEGYCVKDTALAIHRLGRLEDMYESLCSERDRLAQTLAGLSEAGRTKTATYHQLFARRLTLINTIASLETYMNSF